MIPLLSTRLSARLILALPLVATLASGCVANGIPSETPSQPRAIDLSFDCGGGERLRLTGDGASLVATDSSATTVRLSASPPGQSSRYGADGHALVINEREALWMRAGATPMTCRR
ncbi:hypothetical protein GRZ55_02460 [Chelativorans sp. ZYF759]|uniref:hypothetical protein n=1 Tax=Chelativorans sp. ZYF759 TaxID=2692213 RepID=UPI00145D3637|nr:hypothetical protein [Chelativorans sp. ZYF759]NMG38100.1 hypothetical protein [Chelativorans sp. ZYF759]